MRVKSLGYQTDLMVDEFDSEFIDRGSYLVIVTPSVPSYIWGNYLLFGDPPKPGDFVNWQRIFAEEIGCRPAIQHRAFGWDSPAGDVGHIEPFLQAKFRLFQRTVFVASKVHQPPQYNSSIIVKVVVNESDWQQAIHRHHRSEEAMLRYRAMTQAGRSKWFGAFVGDILVGGLGITVKGGIGRFMDVGTHPDFRRRGICRSLVYQASCYAFEHMGVESLVMVAVEDSEAARIYEQIGFRSVERQVGSDDLRP